MCGIAGFVGGGAAGARAELVARRMADAIAHRGPDDGGTWVDADAGVALAHRRLSIVDLSPAGHQPMLSACGRFAITFNGEIYNHAELRGELAQAGSAPRWRGHCDTETLLAAIAAWGVAAALERCVGMFAFALWDRQARTLALARDRLGEKPLYYGFAGRTFLFGSELPALKAHPEFTARIDRGALALMLRLNYVPAPHAIYAGVSKLAPGTYLVLDAGRVTTHRYWNAADVAAAGAARPFAGTPQEAVAEVDALLRRALQGQMQADVPLGAFLSGGLDSSAVVALMQDMSAQPVRTFSIGFAEAGYDEAPYARAVARHLGTRHTELYASMREAMAVVPELPRLYSEPFADASQIPTYLVAKLARRAVTVALSGDGGDELFAGYRRHHLAHAIWPRLSRLPRRIRAAAARTLLAVPPARWDALLAAPLRLLPRGKRPPLPGDKLHKAAGMLGVATADDAYAALLSMWPPTQSLVIGAPAPLPPDDVPAAGAVRRMMYRDLTGYLPDSVLAKVDRATMAVGLEARVPLLDHRLVAFSWRLPLDILRGGGRSKWPLRALLARYLPPALIERPKMGFSAPIDAWLRGDLRDWAEGLIDERRLVGEGLIDPAPVRAAWRAHQEGHRNLGHQLWSVLMFQAWHEAERAAAAQPVASLQHAGGRA